MGAQLKSENRQAPASRSERAMSALNILAVVSLLSLLVDAAVEKRRVVLPAREGYALSLLNWQSRVFAEAPWELALPTGRQVDWLHFIRSLLWTPPSAWLAISVWKGLVVRRACPRCDRDLRDSPERCPQCATAVAMGRNP